MYRETGHQDSGNTRWTVFASAISPLLLLISADLAADTNVFQCTTPSGAIEFSQFPCGAEASEEEITIKDRKTGWVPSVPLNRQKTSKSSKPRHGKRKTGGNNQAAARARREEQCWKKRQLVEEVSRQLRRGYKAGQGVKLRDRRRSYEAYIREFCG